MIKRQQMNKEKEIKEIATLMCRVYDGSCDECGFSPWCCIYDDARNMYNAGYRKQSDVAKQIFEEIEKHTQEKGNLYVQRW